MTIAHLLIAALAVWQCVEIWHHSKLFSTLRAHAEIRIGFLWSLLTCPYCLSVWVSWLMVLPPLLIKLAPIEEMPQGTVDGPLWAVIHLWRFLVYGLAVSRLANLGNDVLYSLCRTPRDRYIGGDNLDKYQ